MKTLFLLLCLLLPAVAPAADPPPPIEDPLNANADYGWFLQNRFGLFIHFGLYSAGARHEWVMNHENMTDQEYRRYFEHFDPDHFDAKAWARMAKQAGMKYVVLTAKHHEGFANWDTRQTDFKVTNTPFHRDVVRETVDAFRAEGIKIGFYYSLLDWHHPDFPVDGLHPMRDNEAFRKANAGRDIKKYAAFVRAQITELLSNYGTIDYLWFDFSYGSRDWGWSKGKGAKEWESEELIELVHKLQPKILVNNRLGLPGGVETPEQRPPGKQSGPLKLVEECNTLNGSWGYDRDNLNWKTPEMLVRLLIESVSKGANLLLNIGPTARGEFDPKARDALNQIGGWTYANGRSIYGAGPSNYTPPNGVLYTQHGDRLYAHLLTYPIGTLELPGLAGKVTYAQFLHDASEVEIQEGGKNRKSNRNEPVGDGSVRLKLPAVRPNQLVPVIELFIKP